MTKKNPLETAVAMARERNMEHSFEDSMLEFTSYSDNFPGILLESIITWQEKPSVILVTSFFHYPIWIKSHIHNKTNKLPGILI